MTGDNRERQIAFDGLDLKTGQPGIGAVSPVEAGRRILDRWRRGLRRPIPEREEAVRGWPQGWGLVCRPDLDQGFQRAWSRKAVRYPANAGL